VGFKAEVSFKSELKIAVIEGGEVVDTRVVEG
jgi:hypothetical protein